jgi:uncharacterized protein YecE (DUF72 family)
VTKEKIDLGSAQKVSPNPNQCYFLKAMEFGKVPASELGRIQFRLPPDDPRTVLTLKSQSQTAPARIGVGAPVWGVKGWEGKVYPLGTDTKEFLFHYSRQFNSIELNTTHYRIPDSETIRRWREATPEGFRFCPKFPQSISHQLPLSSHAGLTREFCENVLKLEDRLGLSFLQLSPQFSPDDLRDLELFLKQMPKSFPLAIEVRHPRFFEVHRLQNDYFSILANAGVSVVITDVAGRRDVLHTSLTTPKVLVRLIGNELHPTDDARVADWISRLKSWLTSGLTEVEFFIHQPNDLLAPDLITRFIDQLNAACGLSVKNWEPMNKGEQLGFF